MDPCFQIPLNPESFPPYYWTRLRKPGDIKGSQFPRFAWGGCKKIQLSPVDSSIGGLTTGKLNKHLQQIQSWETHDHNGFMIIERPFSHTPRCPWGMDQQCLFQSDTPCCTSLVAGLRQDSFWIPLPIVAIEKPGKSMEHYFHIAGIMRQSSVEWGLIHGRTQKSPKPKHSEKRKGTGTHPVETDQT
jgi:hypothetical protein